MKVDFSSNIRCAGCEKTVSSVLDNHIGVKSWQVDLQHPDRKLTLDMDTSYEEEIKDALNSLGYQIVRYN